VTHAYGSLKLLTQRAGLVVHNLLLAAAPNSPRAERIAMQLATCADDFLGAVLARLGAARPGPRTRGDAPCAALRRLVRETLRPEGAPATSRAARTTSTGRSAALAAWR